MYGLFTYFIISCVFVVCLHCLPHIDREKEKKTHNRCYHILYIILDNWRPPRIHIVSCELRSLWRVSGCRSRNEQEQKRTRAPSHWNARSKWRWRMKRIDLCMHLLLFCRFEQQLPKWITLQLNVVCAFSLSFFAFISCIFHMRMRFSHSLRSSAHMHPLRKLRSWTAFIYLRMHDARMRS